MEVTNGRQEITWLHLRMALLFVNINTSIEHKT